MGVCKEFDAYVHHGMVDGLMTLWIAELSNGETIYSDDDRPGEENWNAWSRLKNYVEVNNLKINKLKLKYKSNEISLPDNAEGYFFMHGAKALLTNEYQHRVTCYIVGYVENNQIHITWYKVPELWVEETEIRHLDLGHPGLIMNRG